jgi:hypothetical protein
LFDSCLHSLVLRQSCWHLQPAVTFCEVFVFKDIVLELSVKYSKESTKTLFAQNWE